MAQTNKIDVEIVTPSGSVHPYKDVNYISFVSSPGGESPGTYGIPAIISDESYKSEGLPMRVLFVNPANVAGLHTERTA